MPARRMRLSRSDRVAVTSPYGSRLGFYDLRTGEVTDVAPAFRATFVAELDEWLTGHGYERFPGFPDDDPDDLDARARRGDTLRLPRFFGRGRGTTTATAATPRPPDPPTAALEAGDPTPEGGWSADAADGYRYEAFSGTRPEEPVAAPGEQLDDDVVDLALHSPDHGIHVRAAAARAAGRRDLDRELRLRADGRHAVAEAMHKELGVVPITARMRRIPRWRLLHAVEMVVGSETVALDHVIVGPPGVFIVDVRHRPGSKVHATSSAIDIDGVHVDLARMRTLGMEAHDRLAEAIALAAGFEEVLDPPPVTPVIAMVGATIVSQSRPQGVIVARAGDLPRAMRSRGERLSAAAVEETYAVARRSDTWTS